MCSAGGGGVEEKKILQSRMPFLVDVNHKISRLKSCRNAAALLAHRTVPKHAAFLWVEALNQRFELVLV